MAELLMKTSAANLNKIYYTYKDEKKAEKEYEYRLDWKYRAYNKGMDQNIIFVHGISANYDNIEQYFKMVAKKFDHIQVDEEKLDGMPAIKNTRIPVSLIVACLKDEMSFQEICEEYNLTQEAIEKAMEYIIEILDVPYQEDWK